MALVYKQPGLLNCCMHHSCKDTRRSQVLCTQQVCKAPRKWRWRGGVNEIETLEQKKFVSLKLQDWSLAMEGIHWPGKSGCCQRNALWKCLSTIPNILSSNTPCSSPQAQSYLENSLSLLHPVLINNINQPKLCYWTQIKCDRHLCWWRSGEGTAQSREGFVFFFHCVRMSPMKRGRCSFNNKKKKKKMKEGKEEKKKERCLSCLGSWSTKEQSWAVTSWSCSLEHDTCQAMINGAECVQFQAQCPWDAQDPDRKCYC